MRRFAVVTVAGLLMAGSAGARVGASGAEAGAAR